MERRIKRVKFGSDKKHCFVYEVIKDKENDIIDEFDFKSKDKALPELYNALQTMAYHACRICEFPQSYDKNVTVLGVSFSYVELEDRDDVMGAVITFSKVLDNSNSPLIINTPFKSSEHYNTDENGESPLDDAILLTPACVDALKDLELEAFRYIDGERGEQLSIFNEQSAMSEKQPEAEAIGGSQGMPPTEKQDEDDDYQGEAFKKVEGKPKKKTLTKATKELKKSMNDIVNDPKSGIDSISISHNDKNIINFTSLPGG